MHCKQRTYQRFGGARCRVCRIPSLKIQHAADGADFPIVVGKGEWADAQKIRMSIPRHVAWSHRQHISMTATLPPIMKMTRQSPSTSNATRTSMRSPHTTKNRRAPNEERGPVEAASAPGEIIGGAAPKRTAKRRKFPGDPSFVRGSVLKVVESAMAALLVRGSVPGDRRRFSSFGNERFAGHGEIGGAEIMVDLHHRGERSVGRSAAVAGRISRKLALWVNLYEIVHDWRTNRDATHPPFRIHWSEPPAFPPNGRRFGSCRKHGRASRRRAAERARPPAGLLPTDRHPGLRADMDA